MHPCRLRADVFISTEYTLPSTALLPPHHFWSGSGGGGGGGGGGGRLQQPRGRLDPPSLRRVLLLHDLTPEKFRWEGPFWEAKRAAVEAADAVVAVSRATAAAYAEFYPASFSRTGVVVASNGLDPSWFEPAAGATNSTEPMDSTEPTGADEGLRRLGLDPARYGKPGAAASTDSTNEPNGLNGLNGLHGLDGTRSGYLLVVGNRGGYKNTATLYRALQAAGGGQTPQSSPGVTPVPALVMVGGDSSPSDSPEELELLNGLEYTHLPYVTDDDLRFLYVTPPHCQRPPPTGQHFYEIFYFYFYGKLLALTHGAHRHYR